MKLFALQRISLFLSSTSLTSSLSTDHNTCNKVTKVSNYEETFNGLNDLRHNYFLIIGFSSWSYLFAKEANRLSTIPQRNGILTAFAHKHVRIKLYYWMFKLKYSSNILWIQVYIYYVIKYFNNIFTSSELYLNIREYNLIRTCLCANAVRMPFRCGIVERRFAYFANE